ncbi:fibrous sheath-interacting protein 1 [Ambystoma mexicanum]|uniref:fibrous sheath-interacting protein 1 n=1 Tax=Ambystoma mexicanum TaxID=8296 RepID=UPI0037E7DB2C
MDIVRGGLEEISRPASTSRSRPGSRASSASTPEKLKLNMIGGSLEVLPPEVPPPRSEDIVSSLESSFNFPCDDLELSSEHGFHGRREVSSGRGRTALHASENRETDEDKKRARLLLPAESRQLNLDGRVTSELRGADEDKEHTGLLQASKDKGPDRCKRGTPPLQPSENREADADKRTALHKPHSQTEDTLMQATNSKESSDVEPNETSDEENKDPQLTEAIRKMKKLDKILAKKQTREKEVKYLGQQMRKKLWDELQSATSSEAQQTHEEAFNTRKFLDLIPRVQDMTDTDASEEDVMFTPVFHTQIPAEEVDWQRSHSSLDSKNESSGDPNDSEQRSQVPTKRTCVKNPKRDFIKRNIELAKEAGSAVILMDDEKQRIEDLLKDDDDGRSADTETAVAVFRRMEPGEGYTPEPEEHAMLTRIDAELQAVLSDKDFSSVRSFSSSIQRLGYQESLMTLDGNLELALFESADDVLPGERALRLTREMRCQQARLRDIEQQLEDLENSPRGSLPSLSEQQLKTLLDECGLSPLSEGSTTSLPVSAASSSSRCEGSPGLSPRTLAKLLACSTPRAQGQEGRWTMDEGRGSRCESQDGSWSIDKSGVKMAAEEPEVARGGRRPSGSCSAVPAGEAPEQQEGGYFMAKALSVRKASKPSFLSQPPYCANTTNELCGEADIPGIPEETSAGVLQVEDLTSD